MFKYVCMSRRFGAPTSEVEIVWMNPYILEWKHILCIYSFYCFLWSMGLGWPEYKAAPLLWHIPILECVMDRSENLQGPRVSRDFSRSSSQVIRSYCTCEALPQLAAIGQLGDSIRGFKGPPFSWLCVFRELTPSVGSLCFLSGWGG